MNAQAASGLREPRDDPRPRALITGVGAVSPIGVGVPAYTAALRAGTPGVRALTDDDLGPDANGLRERLRARVAATCDRFRPLDHLDPADAQRLPKLLPMALAAAREACAMAGLRWAADGRPAPSPDAARRVGLILGTGGGGIDFTLDQARIGAEGRRPSLWTITNATHGNLAGELSIRLGLRGPSLCVSTGCASSSDAVGAAMDLVRSARPGAPEAVVVVGADAHVRWETLLSMELLRVLTTRACSDDDPDPRNRPAAASRPFDRTRDGFVLGEGAWALVVEREEHARAREAEPLAELLGYGATCDAYHRVRPAPDLEETARAMRLALDDAGLAPDDVHVLHYHGTSTPANDALESAAVRAAFGPHAQRLRGSAIKSMIGHPQGACGAAALVAAVAAARAMDDDPRGPFVPPTINLREPDPACTLDYTPLEAAPLPEGPTVTLVNCLAFGAKNSALVLAAPPG